MRDDSTQCNLFLYITNADLLKEIIMIRDFLFEFVYPALLATFILSLLISALFLLPYYLSVWDCNAYGKATGRETKFVGLSCYGKIDGVWYSSDEYNKIIVPSRLQLENKEVK